MFGPSFVEMFLNLGGGDVERIDTPFGFLFLMGNIFDFSGGVPSLGQLDQLIDGESWQ